LFQGNTESRLKQRILRASHIRFFGLVQEFGKGEKEGSRQKAEGSKNNTVAFCLPPIA
jgi:hypothetical protein